MRREGKTRHRQGEEATGTTERAKDSRRRQKGRSKERRKCWMIKKEK